jgi:hypothetical protein
VIGRLTTFVLVACLAAACASPARRVHELAALNGFERAEVRGNEFVHVIYRRSAKGRASRIHVYVEHDGLPWATPTRVSSEPTPRDPLVLRLAVQDSASVIYLGRPCYFGLAQSARCSPSLWTRQRYSEAVVSSMAAALTAVLGHSPPELVFLGHSGGATLAWLLAGRFPRSRAVVTVAGNLDVRAWAVLHGYTPLADSLNPADSPDLPPHVLQMHFAGSDDNVVPSRLVRDFVRRRPRGAFVEYPGFNHRCCWERVWPSILDDIKVRLATSTY